MSIDRASDLLRLAEADWSEALDAHILAEPNPEFASRLRDFASAAERQREAMQYAHDMGFEWNPLPSSRDHEPPYELSSRSGRVGPSDLWANFDAVYGRWDKALEQRSLQVVAQAFGDLAEATEALARSVDRLPGRAGDTNLGERKTG